MSETNNNVTQNENQENEMTTADKIKTINDFLAYRYKLERNPLAWGYTEKGDGTKGDMEKLLYGYVKKGKFTNFKDTPNDEIPEYRKYMDYGKKFLTYITDTAYFLARNEKLEGKNAFTFNSTFAVLKLFNEANNIDGKIPEFRPYGWCHWGDGDFIVNVSVAEKDEYVQKNKPEDTPKDKSNPVVASKKVLFDFNISLDIRDEEVNDYNKPQKETIRNRLDKDSDTMKAIKEAAEALKGTKLEIQPKEITKEKLKYKDEKDDPKFEFPYFKIELYDNDVVEKPRNDIENIINELAKAIIIFDAIQKYITSPDESSKQNMINVIQSMAVAQKASISIGPTIERIRGLLSDGCKQLVMTGAPGTGKTFSAKEYVKWQLMTEFVTQQRDNGSTKQDEELIEIFVDTWDKQAELSEPEEDDNSDEAEAIRLIKKGYAMVQFHPSFDYTDFVEGLRPAELNNGNKKEVSFVRMDGVFKEFCRKAANEPTDKKRFFIIDEINRADLSKVFGELMYCLEEGYRGKAHGIKTQYSNLPTYKMNPDGTAELITNMQEDPYREKFYIPENVIIIGTMNDIDRSVDTFDFALRRRFRWINIEVDKNLLTTTFYAMRTDSNKNDTSEYRSDEDINSFVEAIVAMNDVLNSEPYNKSIFKTPKDYFIGPAYFKDWFSGASKEAIWENKVKPILAEYVRGRNMDTFIDDCKKKFIPDSKGKKAEKNGAIRSSN